VNRVELIRWIRREAQRQGVSFESTGTGSRHELFMPGAVRIPVPRPVEIGKRTNEDILHECQAELGSGRWRK